jgi:predicted O-methyltransferase YrrM
LIQRLLAGAGLEKDGISLIIGFLGQSLPEYRGLLAPISLLHLDVDLYDSYKVALENLWEAVSPGGIVIFDEYRHPKWPGATIAIDDFFRDKEQDIIEDKRSHRHYVIKR